MNKEKEPKRILFLAASPTNAQRLRLDEELKRIEQALRGSRTYELHSKMAVTPSDLLRGLLEVRPDVVHFSGHGASNGGLVLENSNGRSKQVSPRALAELFEPLAQEVECVVLNACYSERQARGISEHVCYVMGMENEVADKAAIAFTEGSIWRWEPAVRSGKPTK